MAENTKIQWCDTSWNPHQGCRKVSTGCAHCYMYRQKEAYGQDPSTVVRSKPNTFNLPLKLKEPQRVFVCSWSDYFIEEADAWRSEAWDIMRSTPHLTYIIPTKRPERIAASLPPDWGKGWPNVWLLVSVENQETADERIPILLNTPAAVRGVSIEPMLGVIDLTETGPEVSFSWLAGCVGPEPPIPALDWVIVGGESGDNARTFNVDAANIIVEDCKYHGVPCFVKQMGSAWAKQHGDPDDKGGTFALFPRELQVRQFPEVVR